MAADHGFAPRDVVTLADLKLPDDYLANFLHQAERLQDLPPQAVNSQLDSRLTAE